MALGYIHQLKTIGDLFRLERKEGSGSHGQIYPFLMTELGHTLHVTIDLLRDVASRDCTARAAAAWWWW